jgi:hypothetical protein
MEMRLLVLGGTRFVGHAGAAMGPRSGLAMGRRSEYLDSLAGREIRPQSYNPGGERYQLPTFPWKWAPSGLLTRRQLRAQGLAPGGQDPVAQVLWRHHRQIRVAYLYAPRSARRSRSSPRPRLPAARSAPAAPGRPGSTSSQPTTSAPRGHAAEPPRSQ